MPTASDDEMDLGPLGERLGFRLRLGQNAVSEQAKIAFSRIGLRPPEYGVLLLIDHAPGRKQKDVAAALGVREANLVTTLNRLEKRKLVRRRAAPEDGRTRILDLTKDGKKLLRQAKQIDAGLIKRFDKKLGKGGRARLVALLTKLAAPD